MARVAYKIFEFGKIILLEWESGLRRLAICSLWQLDFRQTPFDLPLQFLGEPDVKV